MAESVEPVATDAVLLTELSDQLLLSTGYVDAVKRAAKLCEREALVVALQTAVAELIDESESMDDLIWSEHGCGEPRTANAEIENAKAALKRVVEFGR